MMDDPVASVPRSLAALSNLGASALLSHPSPLVPLSPWGVSNPIIPMAFSYSEVSHLGPYPSNLSRFSRVRLFATLWTVAHQAPLSMGFSRQEYWSGLPFPSPGDLPDPGTEPVSLTSPSLAGGFFTTCATWEALSPSLNPSLSPHHPFLPSQPHPSTPRWFSIFLSVGVYKHNADLSFLGTEGLFPN